MANFPGPSYNRIIESDPQIISVGMDKFTGWGARASVMPSGGDPTTNNSAAPRAPEMTVKHVASKD